MRCIALVVAVLALSSSNDALGRTLLKGPTAVVGKPRAKAVDRMTANAAAPLSKSGERLQKVIANAGVASRRAAESMVRGCVCGLYVNY
jgi:hypothetical protein